MAVYARDDVQPWPWLDVIGGLRYDPFVWDVDDLNLRTRAGPDTNGDFAEASIVSPKLSLVVRPLGATTCT